ncbi:MAG TPA: acetyl-CoA hydrolase/transferase C-terminal domain-containing protein [Rhizomicrobium sp.]|nr:acetyl-CoA hydrolase/transferase C-terminal domain-containing protein [Rhizomicrobium sp.]
MTARPHILADANAIADAIVAKVGRKIVLGLPLGLGKAPHIANALYARAAADPSIHLTIFTALTLEKPHYKNVLERRFLEPVIERQFGDWPQLEYARALRAGALPPNIEMNEFFFLAGQWLRVPHAQQSYISANYTHASRYLIERGVNVIAQLVAKREERYSLSGNTDITLDLFRARDEGRAKFLVTGQVNAELPFMGGEADLPGDAFDYILDDPSTEFSLFAPPHEPIGYAEYAIGLHTARLVPDGGTLQIGIGKDGDAVAETLILRHRDNATFRKALAALSPDAEGYLAPFDTGLHGLSEMLVSAFLQLIDAGVVKREVDGALLNAGFFLGPKSFYRALREMPESLRAKIRMRPISFTNQLYEGEDAKRAQRLGARFINSTMMVTLLGAAVSDGLEDGRVVSGVGGQYDFFAQAFALRDARAILTLNATRRAGTKATSNVRWSYGHETIPRHLRDVVVSEYGVADLRGRPDAETIAAMLNIADSRFQGELLRQAKDAGKIAKGYEIPPRYRDNTPERIERALKPFRDAGHMPAFPFGSDFDETEQKLLPALEKLEIASRSVLSLLRLAMKGFGGGDDAALARMQLDRPGNLSDRFYRLLLRGALRE